MPTSPKPPCGADPGPGSNDRGPWWVNVMTNTIVHSNTRPGPTRGPAVTYAGFKTQAEAKAFVCHHPGGQRGKVFAPGAARLSKSPCVRPGLLGDIPVIGQLTWTEYFVCMLTQRETWVRIAEVTLGSALILVGLAKLMENTEAGKALRSAIPAVAKIVPK